MQTFSPATPDSYKALARTWAATVTVVSVLRAPEHVTDLAPALDGFTATAFVTVSIEPPIVLVAATRASSALSMLRESAGFAVNLLGADQVDVSAAFARSAADRVGLFDRLPSTRDADGVPLLEGTTGAYSARVRQLVDAGDHTLVLGDVTAVHLGEGTDTLVYHDRGYGRVTRRA
jgi:flavin reductase (DIM6/NTAB) family NADH-FMN oxidoreductase RutF